MKSSLDSLSRLGLLERILHQRQRLDDLQRENQTLKETLEARQVIIGQSPTLAQAIVQLSGLSDQVKYARRLYEQELTRRQNEAIRSEQTEQTDPVEPAKENGESVSNCGCDTDDPADGGFARPDENADETDEKAEEAEEEIEAETGTEDFKSADFDRSEQTIRTEEVNAMEITESFDTKQEAKSS